MKLFVRYILVGCANTIISVAMMALCMRVLSINYLLSNMIGYGVGFLSSYFLNKNWTFNYHDEFQKSFIRWSALFAFAYSLNLIAVYILIEYAKIDSILAQGFGVVLYTGVGFLGGKLFVFKANNNSSGNEAV